jgi:hypothetical protein
MTLSAHRCGTERAGWLELPASCRAAVERNLGAGVVHSLRQTPEFDGGIVTRLQLDDGRWVYLKALPADSPRAGSYHAEADVTARLPQAAPVPRLLSAVRGEWVVLVFSDLEGTRPKLRPGSPDLSAVFTTMGALARTLTPCPIEAAPDALDDLGPLLRGWHEVCADPPEDLDDWSLRNLDSLVALETAWHPWAAGDTLLHNDLHPGNLVRTGPGRVVAVGWRYPARGAAWLDLVSLVPHLLVEGNEPADIDRLLRRRPALRGVPAWAVTGFGVALAGHAERTCRLPAPPGAAGVRAYQRSLAAVTRRWLAHRTHWS